MHLKIEDPDGILPTMGQEGGITIEQMREVFEEALALQGRKGFAYGETWREQGWMGNLGRVLGKVSRIRHMLWRDTSTQRQSADEPVDETLLDTINIAAFALINYRNGNKWGGGPTALINGPKQTSKSVAGKGSGDK